MKRITVILLALLLILQCACGKKAEGNAISGALEERQEQLEKEREEKEEEEEEEKEKEEKEEDAKEEAEEEAEAPAAEAPAAEAPAAEAPAVEAPAVEAPAVEAPAPEAPAEGFPEADPYLHMAFLTEFVAASLIPLDWNNEYYEMFPSVIMETEPATLEGSWGANPYGISAALVTDVNGDGGPELILQAGEVEQQFYIFTVRDDAVHCTGIGMLDNQTGSCYLVQYWDRERFESILVSEGASGSGAGNYYFLYYTDPSDLSCREAAFCGFDEYSEAEGYHTVWYRGGDAISDEEYTAMRDDFFETLALEHMLFFTPLGEDPVSTVLELMDIWIAENG